MAKKRRTKNPFQLSFFSPFGKKRPGSGDTLLNSAIAILSIILIAFILSFASKYTRGGLEMDTASLDQNQEPMLATQYYAMNPIQDIEVEILNGCGESGLAAKLSEYLRSRQIDVVRSENADHFNYSNTLIIQRNEKVENVRKVAGAFDMDITDNTRVMVIPQPDRDVDVTIIVGKDYTGIKPISDFLDKQY